MLRLEPSSESPDVVLQFREKDRFFNSFFMRAFLIAISFHGMAGVIFSIAPFQLTSSFIFSPVQMQSEAPALHSTLLTADPNNEMPELFPTPIPLLWPLSFTFTESTFIRSTPLDVHAFESLERENLPKWTLPSFMAREQAIAQLFITGELANYILHKQDDRLVRHSEFIYPSLDSPLSIAYQVQMEEYAGKIFWYERIQTSGIEKLDKLTEDFLFSLQFEKKNSMNIVSGTVTFIINTAFMEMLSYD
jgi:hypothetical protein